MKSANASRHYVQTARAQSAEANGRRILDAFLARLMQQWFDEITLESVAADADVTVQTIVRRFGGKEGLLEKAVAILSDQIKAQRSTPSGDLGKVVDNLMGDYEVTGDAVVRLLALEPRHTGLKGVLDIGRREHRRWAVQSFSEWLAKLDPKAEEKVLDALVVATDVYTWKLLRRDMNRTKSETCLTIRALVEGILSTANDLN